MDINFKEAEKKIEKVPRHIEKLEPARYSLGADIFSGNYRVILSELSKIYHVISGQLVLLQSPPVNKKFGYLPGENIITDSVTSRFYSTEKGILCFRGKYITVDKVKEIGSFKKVSKKRLSFKSSVIFNKTVPSGTKIKSKGDVYFLKPAEDIEIKSGGNIFFLEGITCKQKVKVKSEGIIFAKFAENAELTAGESVIVSEYLKDCDITAGSSVEMFGEKQKISGGSLKCGYFINCKVLGSKKVKKTKIILGFTGDEEKNRKKLGKNLNKVNKKILSYEKKIKESNIQEKNNTVDKFRKEVNKLMGLKMRFENRLRLIKRQVSEREHCRLTVTDKIYPGIMISCGKDEKLINKPDAKLSFIYNKDNNKIITGSLERGELEFDMMFTHERNLNLNIIDKARIRRSLKIEGRNIEEAFSAASNYLDLSSEKLTFIVTDKNKKGKQTFFFFEVKPGETKKEVARKSMQYITLKRIMVTGESIEKCLKKASRILKIPVDKLDYKIIQKKTGGFLGLRRGKEYIIEVFKSKKKKPEKRKIPIDGTWITENTSAGLLLKITPPYNDGHPVELADIKKHFEVMNYEEGIDEELILKLIENPDSEFVKIGPHQVEPEKAADFSIIISDDSMKVELLISKPVNDEKLPDLKDIENKLREKGVVEFNLEQVEKHYINNDAAGKKIVVAEGQPPVPPVKSRIDIKIEDDGLAGTENKARINYKDISIFTNVVKDSLLAERIQGVSGKDGRDVFGNTVSAEKETECSITAGKNVRVSEDGLRYYAEKDGWFVLDRGVIKVEDIYYVNGDVNFSTGNIKSLNSIVIKGAVKDGFEVESEGDVFVDSVEGAKISAKGNIIVRNGVAGRGSCNIKCNGRFESKYVEQGYIEAEGDVIVSEAIMHSRVISNGSVIVQKGKKGLIVGGKISAKNIIAANNIGSILATNTELETGIYPFAHKEFKKEVENYKQLKKKYAVLKLNIKKIIDKRKKMKKVSKKNEQILSSLYNKYKRMLEYIEHLPERIDKLHHQARKTVEGYILVKDKMYSNVNINISNTFFRNKDELSYLVFYKEKSKIELKEYDESIIKRILSQ